MKTVVICPARINNIGDNHFFSDINLDGEDFIVGLIDVPDYDYKRFLTSQSVLVRIHAFSCNFRDRALFHIFNEQCRENCKKEKIVYSPIGSEFVGSVIFVGKDVKNFKVGDRVMPNHCYPFKSNGNIGGVITNFASQRLHIFNESVLIKVPDEMSDEEAAAFPLSAQTAYSMVRKANLKDNDNVLVTSMSSNTSLSCLEALKNQNVNIYSTSTCPNELHELGKSLGVMKIYNLHELKENKAQTNIPFLDAVIDPFIDINIKMLTPFLNFGARYVFCGVYQQSDKYKKSDFPQMDMALLHNLCITKNVSIIGNCLGNTSDLEDSIYDYVNNRYKVHIDSVYDGNNIADFFNRTFNEHHLGKVIYKY